MRIFKNKAFQQWLKEIRLSDQDLKKAIVAMNCGMYDANLGGNIYKKRIAVGGRGKSSGVRTIVAFKEDDKAFFVYGFAKNVRSNISEQEERVLKALAKVYFSYSVQQLELAIKAGQLLEVRQ